MAHFFKKNEAVIDDHKHGLLLDDLDLKLTWSNFDIFQFRI